MTARRCRAILAAALVLLVAALPAPRVAAEADPLVLLVNFLDAETRGDVRGALALLDPEVVYRGLLICDPEPCIGRAAVGEVLMLEAADGAAHRLAVEAAEPDGAGVVASGELQAGWIPNTTGRLIYSVRCDAAAGRITALHFSADERDSRTRLLLADLRGVRDAFDEARAEGWEGAVSLPAP